jgi:hypothetical protein
MSPQIKNTRKSNGFNPRKVSGKGGLSQRRLNQIHQRPGTAKIGAKPFYSTVQKERKQEPLSKRALWRNRIRSAKNISNAKDERQGHLLRPQTSASRRSRRSNPALRVPVFPSKKEISLVKRPETAPSSASSLGNVVAFQYSDQEYVLTRLEKYELMRNKQAAKETRRAEIYAINRVLRGVFQAEFSTHMKRKETE